MTLSVVIITYNEEANIGRCLESVRSLVTDGKGDVIVVDSGSTDRTVAIAKSYGATVFVREWGGYADQKNFAIQKATGDWILSLDADESLDPGLVGFVNGHSSSPQMNSAEWWLTTVLAGNDAANLHLSKEPPSGFWFRRKNFFLGRWIKHGGFWPDPKLRLFQRAKGHVKETRVHEVVEVEGNSIVLPQVILHHSYPTLSDYIDHMNRYSSLGAEMTVGKGVRGFSVVNIVCRPLMTFIYNYFFRLGFLDGREGLLLHLYHAVYVSWKYSKTWELQRKS